MTRPTDAAATALAQLVGQIAQSLRAGDDAAARAQAATQVEQLRAIVAQTPQAQAAASPLFDLAQVSEAMRVFAEWLRAPTSATEAQATQAIAGLQAMMGPLASLDPPRDEAAERERIRQNARSAMDDYFREHPIKPMKP